MSTTSLAFQDPYAVASQVHALLTKVKVKVKATGRGFVDVGPRAGHILKCTGTLESRVGTEAQTQVTCPDFHKKQVPNKECDESRLNASGCQVPRAGCDVKTQVDAAARASTTRAQICVCYLLCDLGRALSLSPPLSSSVTI